MTRLRSFCTYLTYVVLALVIVAFVALVGAPIATNSTPYTALTNSMLPKFAPGTFMVMQKVSFGDIMAGDVVTYQVESGQEELITHRVTGFAANQQGERLLILKGDNNSVADEDPVQEEQVRGKLLYAVPYVGRAIRPLSNLPREAIAMWVLAGGLVAYGVRGVVRKRRQKDSSAAPVLSSTEAAAGSADTPAAPVAQ